MNKISCALIGLTLLVAACNKSEKETPNGFKFTMVKAGDGQLPKKDELLVFSYIIKNSKDSVWIDTEENGFPGVVKIQDSSALKTEIGMQQMFRMLSKGDSVTITRSTKDFFKNVLGGQVPPNVDTTLSMSCNLKVTDIMSQEKFQGYQAELMKKKESKQKVKDAQQIDKYLADNNITAQTDTSGVRYVLYTNLGGKKPTVANCVEVKYSGKFLKDGKEFDKSDRISFPLEQMIQAWKIGIPMLGIGDSATFFVPSGLGYGPQGYNIIPPDAVLIFNVQLLDFKNGYDQATRTCK
jgi:FKBP-type peptidyl-prolyl cis-trans isomerase FkpA